jgi:hypothetical protein
VAHRDPDSVDLGAARGKAMQGRYEVERGLEIGRALAAGSPVSEIRARRHRPGAGDPWLDCGQVLLRQPEEAFPIADAPPAAGLGDDPDELSRL